ncbi:MAG: hypothetical protein IH624_13260 [Phycisphaerae bacterium]|nr:hypothetical protein [Phycisphaerae bacterium]
MNTGFWLAYEWLCARHKEDGRLRRGKRVLTPVLGCVAVLTWVLAVVMVCRTDIWGLGALALAALCLCVNWSILGTMLSGSPRYFLGMAHRLRPSKWPEAPTEKDMRSARNILLGLTLGVDFIWIGHAVAIVYFSFSLMPLPVNG